ncbi:hypothetical protein [Conservatibacter flavescens]|uniref:DUF3299 domain-containing protein n=1 Tax=Conservatibacter flavescens TaxID=28161 RepID=A0A2M8S4B5_9PAST|nr:hypothetical protein [Conservatibacter flavescens]PJG85974.1 hypothetical protein CVP05_02040 [Conservatibacter flavescens]
MQKRKSVRAGVIPLFLSIFLFLGLNTHSMANNTLNFDQLYGQFSVTGLEFSDKVKELEGKKVTIRGFMAPPLKPDANFFVLTKTPMALCPFCDSDSDWPEDILVVYLKKRQNFVQFNAIIEVEGRLEKGSWTDPDTGFVSLLRLRDAVFREL